MLDFNIELFFPFYKNHKNNDFKGNRNLIYDELQFRLQQKNPIRR
ncbi:hypothetical protein HMPREF0204_11643 [Chryseobacterium gleum ATCC 35910]|uniref:Uncharacterized protein n=1 Tax=Chryseobacterium gleum ATCC 35910 TaxID=525257 RepID=A0ABN0ATZ7_CHRGE|nr:hypothetical protein HMPREF0204_11643 [Chryseobacterium gleum ATCC 35910]